MKLNFMLSLRSKSQYIKNKYYSLMGVFFGYLLVSPVGAALLTDTESGVSTNLGSNTNAIEMGRTGVQLTLQSMAVIVGAAVTLGLGMLIVQSLQKTSDDRDEGAWPKFFKTTVASVVVIAIVDGLALVAFNIVGSWT